MNHAHRLGETLLIKPLASPRLQHQITRGDDCEWVVAQEDQDPGPLGNHRDALIPLPAVVNLTQSAELPRYILLTQIQQQPSTAKMLPKSPWLGDDAFLSENECFKRIVAHQDREKAKWQNRVIPILPFYEFLIAGKLVEVEHGFTIHADFGSDNHFWQSRTHRCARSQPKPLRVGHDHHSRAARLRWHGDAERPRQHW